MANLFSGLEDLGLGNLSEMNIYEEQQKETAGKKAGVAKPVFSEEENIFDKTFTCPVCEEDFKTKMVKTGKIKLLNLDPDLRPIYQYMDPLKYDAILCPHCGYAALNRFFRNVTDTQALLIKKNISAAFRGMKEKEGIFSYDDALMRHKMALVNSVVKKSKLSERAYTCLKTAWILRGKAETLPQDTPDYQKQMEALEAEELDCVSKAYAGFDEAYGKEEFPMCGMDEVTITLLMAELSRRLGRYDECGRWVSRVLVSKEASERIKEKARDIKERLKEDKTGQ